MGKLDGKFAIVTGGGQGIGRSIVKQFLDDGASGVAILDISTALMEKTAEELRKPGSEIICVKCDISCEEQVRKAIKTVVEKFGTIDILVNNAGITQDSMFHKMTQEQWDKVIKINLYGVFHMCRHVVPIMREKAYGKIINIASISAYGNIGQANYSASKGALISFTKTLSLESGPKNITVNCIAPGFIETEMYAAVPEAIIEKHISRIPLKRLGTPGEVASVAAFLASEEATFVTGQIIDVAGGGSL